MKRSGPKSTIMLILLAIVLIISTVSSIGISTKNDLINSESFNAKSSIARLKVGAGSNALAASELSLTKGSTIGTAQEEGIKLIAGSEDNEFYPSTVFNSKNGIIAYESEGADKNRVYLKTTQDYGLNWSEEPYTFEIALDQYNSNFDDLNTTQPDLTIQPFTNHVYGVTVSPLNNSAVFSYFDCYDITQEPSTWDPFSLDWTNVSYNETSGEIQGFWGFSNPEILSYQNADTPWVIVLAGSTDYKDEVTGEGPAEDTPMFCFRDLLAPESYISIAWFPDIEGCKNIAIANDYGDDMIYGVCEIENGTNQDLLFFRGNPNSWYNDEELENLTITASENLLNPQIFVKESNIYIVAETDTKGIVLYNSSNGGATWVQRNVTSDLLAPTSTPRYPDIIGNNTHISVSFVEDGNLSIVHSSDKGLSWTTPMQVNERNETVQEGFRQTDISDLSHIVWTDNRNIAENGTDIFGYIGSPPSMDLEVVADSIRLIPEFNIEVGGRNLIPTHNIIEYKIRNNGVTYVENVEIKITFTCGEDEPNLTYYPDVLTYLAGDGTEQTMQTNLFRFSIDEFFQALIDYAGVHTITVTAEVENDATPEDNSAELYKEEGLYKDIFPKMYFLEDILINF